MAEEYITEAHQLPPGTVLHGRFEIRRVIGEGGFGITYEGRDQILDARVAIKEYYMTGFVNRNTAVSLDVIPSVGEKAETFRKNREKFYSEAMVLAKFGEEDGIVRIQDYFQENETAYIVMEYLDGGSLKDRLNKDGAMNWEEALDLLMPGMVSLEHVHEAGIIHRDISPDNIMLTKSGKIRILDFGAARKTTESDPKSLSVILKPGYAPEEQYRSKGVQGPWTDVYAFCATLYKCITGNVPEEAMDRLVSDTLRPIHFLVPECPVSVSKVIGKGMAVSQQNRYQTMGELIADLEWARQNPGATELPESRRQDEPLIPADVLGDPFADLERIMRDENAGEMQPDLLGMFDESLPLVQVSLPGLTTERRSGTYKKSVTGQRSAPYSRPISVAPVQEMDPNATVYAGKVETYTSPKEDAPAPQAEASASQEGTPASEGGTPAPQGLQGGSPAPAPQGAAAEGTASVPQGAAAEEAGFSPQAETSALQAEHSEEEPSVPLQFISQPDPGEVSQPDFRAIPDRSLPGAENAAAVPSEKAGDEAGRDAAAAVPENKPEKSPEPKPEKKTGLFSTLKNLFS